MTRQLDYERREARRRVPGYLTRRALEAVLASGLLDVAGEAGLRLAPASAFAPDVRDRERWRVSCPGGKVLDVFLLSEHPLDARELWYVNTLPGHVRDAVHVREQDDDRLVVERRDGP